MLSIAACVALASAHYGVTRASIQGVLANRITSADRVGVMSVPVGWLPYLQQNGFDAGSVRTDDCENVVAGAWILAYMRQFRERMTASGLNGRAKKWQPLVKWVAARADMPTALIDALIEQESGFNPRARSPAGAIGMMQIMPANARAWGINPFDPAQNVWAGTWYLKYLLRRYHGSLGLALAAYNAGSAAVDRYGGIPPYDETKKYVPRVLSNFRQYASAEN